MKKKLHIEQLKAMYRQGTLPHEHETELIELLEQTNNLEEFLDNEIRVAPLNQSIYNNKAFLKSLSEPQIKLKADTTIAYLHKKRLYRKRDTTPYIYSIIKYTSGIAAVIICILHLYTYKEPQVAIESVDKIIEVANNSENSSTEQSAIKDITKVKSPATQKEAIQPKESILKESRQIASRRKKSTPPVITTTCEPGIFCV